MGGTVCQSLAQRPSGISRRCASMKKSPHAAVIFSIPLRFGKRRPAAAPGFKGSRILCCYFVWQAMLKQKITTVVVIFSTSL
ncbi:MAG: hypothetical protein GXY32_04210 [Ruminococcaceae bacterium]|nr:hypothetical protein [Oscillospiraceae bacterium]